MQTNYELLCKRARILEGSNSGGIEITGSELNLSQ